MPDWKTQFTNPAEPGADQATTFIHSDMENNLTQIPITKITNESVTRGEKRFMDYPRAI